MPGGLQRKGRLINIKYVVGPILAWLSCIGKQVLRKKTFQKASLFYPFCRSNSHPDVIPPCLPQQRKVNIAVTSSWWLRVIIKNVIRRLLMHGLCTKSRAPRTPKCILLAASCNFYWAFRGFWPIPLSGRPGSSWSGRKRLIPDFMSSWGPGQSEGSNEQVLREVEGAPSSKLGDEPFLSASHPAPTIWGQPRTLVQNFQLCCLP